MGQGAAEAVYGECGQCECEVGEGGWIWVWDFWNFGCLTNRLTPSNKGARKDSAAGTRRAGQAVAVFLGGARRAAPARAAFQRRVLFVHLHPNSGHRSQVACACISSAERGRNAPGAPYGAVQGLVHERIRAAGRGAGRRSAPCPTWRPSAGQPYPAAIYLRLTLWAHGLGNQAAPGTGRCATKKENEEK
jgi:hypothetical protein